MFILTDAATFSSSHFFSYSDLQYSYFLQIWLHGNHHQSNARDHACPVAAAGRHAALPLLPVLRADWPTGRASALITENAVSVLCFTKWFWLSQIPDSVRKKTSSAPGFVRHLCLWGPVAAEFWSYLTARLPESLCAWHCIVSYCRHGLYAVMIPGLFGLAWLDQMSFAPPLQSPGNRATNSWTAAWHKSLLNAVQKTRESDTQNTIHA